MPKQKSTTSVISTQLSFLDIPIEDKRPLPEIIASGGSDWAAFPLAVYVSVDGVRYYAVRDWIKGIAFAPDPGDFWKKLKKRTRDMWGDMVSPCPYVDAQGKTIRVDHATAEGLYAITQRMDTNTGVRDRILAYLAKAGVKLDEYRREPSLAVSDAINEYVGQGKTPEWSATRIQGVINRKAFATAIVTHVMNVDPSRHIAEGTNTMYRGLWGRDTETLKAQIGLSKNDNLRDHQTRLALHYQGIVEELVAHYLGERQTVDWHTAKKIIADVARLIGIQADQVAQLLGVDLATGKALLHA